MVAPTPVRVSFAQACVETRIALDLTQQQVADRLGVSRSYVAKGRTRSPRPHPVDGRTHGRLSRSRTRPDDPSPIPDRSVGDPGAGSCALLGIRGSTATRRPLGDRPRGRDQPRPIPWLDRRVGIPSSYWRPSRRRDQDATRRSRSRGAPAVVVRACIVGRGSIAGMATAPSRRLLLRTRERRGRTQRSCASRPDALELPDGSGATLSSPDRSGIGP